MFGCGRIFKGFHVCKNLVEFDNRLYFMLIWRLRLKGRLLPTKEDLTLDLKVATLNVRLNFCFAEVGGSIKTGVLNETIDIPLDRR